MTTGDLVSSLDVTAQAAGATAMTGGKLRVARGSEVSVTIRRFREWCAAWARTVLFVEVVGRGLLDFPSCAETLRIPSCKSHGLSDEFGAAQAFD